MDEDGFLFVIDRLKRMIHLSNGVNLLPSKVERKLTELAEVTSCAVIAHREADNSVVAKVFAVVNSDEMTPETLLHYCDENIPGEYCVKYAEIIDHMPLTPVGKVDYRALERDAQKGM